MGKHLVFYDGECGLCDHVVQFLLKWDTNKVFVFAPLQGETASQTLSHLPEEVKTADSLILLEDYQAENPTTWIFGKGVFRILWLMGGAWRLIGWKCFLPAFVYDWAYRLVARYRYRLFTRVCTIPDPSNRDRFLP